MAGHKFSCKKVTSEVHFLYFVIKNLVKRSSKMSVGEKLKCLEVWFGIRESLIRKGQGTLF